MREYSPLERITTIETSQYRVANNFSRSRDQRHNYSTFLGKKNFLMFRLFWIPYTEKTERETPSNLDVALHIREFSSRRLPLQLFYRARRVVKLSFRSTKDTAKRTFGPSIIYIREMKLSARKYFVSMCRSCWAFVNKLPGNEKEEGKIQIMSRKFKVRVEKVDFGHVIQRCADYFCCYCQSFLLLLLLDALCNYFEKIGLK